MVHRPDESHPSTSLPVVEVPAQFINSYDGCAHYPVVWDSEAGALDCPFGHSLLAEPLRVEKEIACVRVSQCGTCLVPVAVSAKCGRTCQPHKVNCAATRE